MRVSSFPEFGSNLPISRASAGVCVADPVIADPVTADHVMAAFLLNNEPFVIDPVDMHYIKPFGFERVGSLTTTEGYSVLDANLALGEVLAINK